MVGRTAPGWFPPRPSTFAYALGLYLGDGCLYVRARGSPLLQIRLDRSHPELWPWQTVIIERAPQAFLRGLIHSDGCRTVNRFKTRLPSGRIAEYAYPRYFFSNRSADIRG